MKKRRNLNEIENVPRANPVAKHAFQFNKAQVFADKKQYQRKAKHGKQEAFANKAANLFTKVSWFSPNTSLQQSAYGIV